MAAVEGGGRAGSGEVCWPPQGHRGRTSGECVLAATARWSHLHPLRCFGPPASPISTFRALRTPSNKALPSSRSPSSEALWPLWCHPACPYQCGWVWRVTTRRPGPCCLSLPPSGTATRPTNNEIPRLCTPRALIARLSNSCSFSWCACTRRRLGGVHLYRITTVGCLYCGLCRRSCACACNP